MTELMSHTLYPTYFLFYLLQIFHVILFHLFHEILFIFHCNSVYKNSWRDQATYLITNLFISCNVYILKSSLWLDSGERLEFKPTKINFCLKNGTLYLVLCFVLCIKVIEIERERIYYRYL